MSNVVVSKRNVITTLTNLAHYSKKVTVTHALPTTFFPLHSYLFPTAR